MLEWDTLLARGSGPGSDPAGSGLPLPAEGSYLPGCSSTLQAARAVVLEWS